ncbi:LLM class flavin-dependent oxidoreductase [Amycolatopsis jejuensis]|uniref:LLM class flavin-dependent oxidoreductase n=1 Tax=Amycolatopsis jejuensis TaxID=330084 RepID=UPI000525C865|nr:LLM class flavin-dependent oxidoreductase [Amycolatopsis jejuensis]
MSLLFGANVDPLWQNGDAPLRQALAAEEYGLDLITIQDHPYQVRFHDTWTLLTFLAARTERITFVPTVACLPLRPPAILAKAVASLYLLSGGRVQLGLGAGGFWDAIAAMGGPRRTPREAIDAQEEAIDVIRAMWSGERSARTDGSVYRLSGVHPGPPPGPDLGLWLGSYGPRALKLTGARADGWLPSHAYLPLDALPAASARIDEGARAAGRDPSAIRKVYNISGTIADTSSSDPFTGTVAQWADQAATAADAGITGFVFWPAGDYDGQMRRFAEEVVPAIRARLS